MLGTQIKRVVQTNWSGARLKLTVEGLEIKVRILYDPNRVIAVEIKIGTRELLLQAVGSQTQESKQVPLKILDSGGLFG